LTQKRHVQNGGEKYKVIGKVHGNAGSFKHKPVNKSKGREDCGEAVEEF